MRESIEDLGSLILDSVLIHEFRLVIYLVIEGHPNTPATRTRGRLEQMAP